MLRTDRPGRCDRRNLAGVRLSVGGMVRSFYVGLAALAFCSCSRPAAAPSAPPTQRVDFDAETEPRVQAREPDPGHTSWTGYVTACASGSEEQRAAHQLLTALDEQVRKAPVTDDGESFNESLRALLAHPCLALARIDGANDIEADSALAAKAFWDHGGYRWLRSYVDLDPAAGGGTISLPPSMRTTMTREHRAQHPLAPMMCSAQDQGCGRMVDAWASRAERTFERWNAGHDPEDPSDGLEACRLEALEAEAGQRYVVWRDCVGELGDRRSALPLGGLQVPRSGWLVIRGRRGHYNFCDEVRAYELGSGAAYVSSSCGGLSLRTGGSVDHAKTDAGRSAYVSVGKLPVDYLREAAWMILLAEHVQARARTSAYSVPIPPEVVPARPEGSLYSFEGLGYSWSSSQTSLAWTYSRGQKPVATGTITWPEHYDDAALDHAVNLLKIAEAGFEAGCAPVRMPTRLLRDSALSSVSGLDADPDRRAATVDALSQALEAQAKRGRCVKTP